MGERCKMKTVKQSGRIALLLLLPLAVVVIWLFVVLTAPPNPGDKATEFMQALAKGDVDRLTEMSYMPGLERDEIRKRWEYTTQVVGPHYGFIFRLQNHRMTAENEAAVRFEVYRDIYAGTTYAEPFEIPMIRVNDEWLVDVRSINRDFYPGLPR
jgi:hypothetical protein